MTGIKSDDVARAIRKKVEGGLGPNEGKRLEALVIDLSKLMPVGLRHPFIRSCGFDPRNIVGEQA